jgi:hypothetical protein
MREPLAVSIIALVAIVPEAYGMSGEIMGSKWTLPVLNNG